MNTYYGRPALKPSPYRWKVALYTFLGVNDVDFDVPEAEAAAIILSLAAGEVSEESLTRWIRDNWPPQ